MLLNKKLYLCGLKSTIMSENKGAKRPRIGQRNEHKEVFMQDTYFNYHHHDDEASEDNGKQERKFGRKFSDEAPGERKFGKRRFDDDNERGSSRSFDRRENKPGRRDFDNEKPFGRRFNDEDRPSRRRFNNDERPTRRRFNDDDERPSRRRFNDDERPSRRRFNDDERPSRRRFNDDDRPSRRRFNDDERPSRRKFDRDEKPFKKRFSDDDERPSRRRFDDDSREKGGKKPYGDKDRQGFGGRSRRKFDNDEPRNDKARGKRGNYGKRNDYEDDEAPRRGRKGYQREKDPVFDRPKATGEIRLNKYLADSGVCSRREADELIKAGCVTVNGEVITTMGFKVKPEDKVVYGGQTLNREKLRYILLNKPKGYITTSDDPQERNTVMDLMKDVCPERIFPVGRLDKMTTGLLLFTNDGDLTKRLTHPSSEVPKLYQVTLDKPLTKNDMLRIANGIELDDGPIAADAISYVEGDDSKKEIGIELHSGRNRIVRRIFEHLGYEVLKLDRSMFAGLDKYKLPRGEWRFLTDQEVNMLKKI